MKKLSFILLPALAIMAACGDAEQDKSAAAPEIHETPVSDEADNKMDEDMAAKSAMEFTDLIEQGSIGEVSVGDSRADLEASFGADRVQSSSIMVEGDEYEIWQVLDLDGNVAFELDIDCDGGCKVDRITVLDPQYKTVGGLGVGSTFEEIQKKHSGLDIFAGETGIMVYTKEMKQVAYILDSSGQVFEPEQEFGEDEILGETKVVSVYTF